MRKWQGVVLGLALCLALSAPALAESNQAPSGAENRPAVAARFTDEQRETIKDKWDQFKALKDEGQALHAQVRAQRETNRELLEQVRDKYRGPLRDQTREQREALRDHAAGLRERLQPLHEELRGLRAELKQVHEQRHEAAMAVRDALKDGNFGQVVSGLERLTRIQQEHNRILSQILDLQQQVTEVLQKALA